MKFVTIPGKTPAKKNNRKSVGRFTIPGDRYKSWSGDACKILPLILPKIVGPFRTMVTIHPKKPKRKRPEGVYPQVVDADNGLTSVLDTLKDAARIGDDRLCAAAITQYGEDRDEPCTVVGIEAVPRLVYPWAKPLYPVGELDVVAAASGLTLEEARRALVEAGRRGRGR